MVNATAIDDRGNMLKSGDLVFIFAGTRYWPPHFYTESTKDHLTAKDAFRTSARFTENKSTALCISHREFAGDLSHERFALLFSHSKFIMVSTQNLVLLA